MSKDSAKPTPDFSLDEFVRELENVSAREETSKGFITTDEICKITKCRMDKVRKVLLRLKEEGRLEVGEKRVRFLDDTWRTKPAYKVIPKKEVKE